MNVPHVSDDVREAPLFSVTAPQDLVIAGLFLLSLYFLFLEQNLSLFAASFMLLAFLYHPNKLSISGRYGVSTDLIT